MSEAPRSELTFSRWYSATTVAFAAIHLLPFAALTTEVRPAHYLVGLGLFVARIFFLNAGYHRYFAHRAYKMARTSQCLMALGGTLAAQKGPLWWAGMHRVHHKHTDRPGDPHSPRSGFWRSHMTWFLSDQYQATPADVIEDFAKYPELRLLDRYHYVPPVILAGLCLWFLGPAGLYVSFALSTVVTYHSIYCVNSLCHRIGTRRFNTNDDSTNFWLVAVLTLGEGWHNNHHRYPYSIRQGHKWWEFDGCFYILWLMRGLGLARDFKYAQCLTSRPQRASARRTRPPPRNAACEEEA